MEDYFKKCRLCLSIKNGEKMISIYDKSEIALKIFLCTQVKIMEYCTEKLPALICIKCLEDLAIAVDFRLRVQRSDKIFRKQMKFNELDLFSHKMLEIKHETTDKIEFEPTFEFIDNIETIFGNSHYSTFENVNIRTFEEDISDVHNSSTCKERRKHSRKEFIDISETKHESNTSVSNPIGIDEHNYNCKYCTKTFKHKSYLKRHTTNVHNVNPKIKSKLGNLKNNRSKESGILNKHYDNTPYCEICQHFFTTRGSLQKHMKVRHEFVDINDRYMCDFCGELFVIKYYLVRHIRVKHLKTHVNEKRIVDSPIPCEVCGKILRNRGLLKPHMRSHQVMTANDYWYCDLCPRKFKTRGGCKWHIQQRHILKATFKCPYENCPVIYKGKWELKCHIKSKHTNQRDFRCEICGKGFLDKQKLQIHTRIHTGERPHACHLCTATFIHQTDLRRHIWGHTGERPIKCGVPNCGKGFMKKSELVNHTNRCHAPPIINFNSKYSL